MQIFKPDTKPQSNDYQCHKVIFSVIFSEGKTTRMTIFQKRSDINKKRTSDTFSPKSFVQIGETSTFASDNLRNGVPTW